MTPSYMAKYPAISCRLAYAGDESGRYEIYLRPYPEVNRGKWPVSKSGGDWPLWSREGRKLLYRNGDAFLSEKCG